MKKITAMLLCFALLFTIVSCGSASGVTMEQLKEKLKMTDEDWQETEEKSGFTYEYSNSSYTENVNYSINTDKKKNITSAEVTYKDVDVSYINTSDKAEKLFNEAVKDMSGLTLGEFKVATFIIGYLNITTAFGVDGSAQWNEFLSVFDGEVFTYKNWTYTVELNASEKSIVLKAVFGK